MVTDPHTLYITTVRDPVARTVSLFYYDGPGAKDPNASAAVSLSFCHAPHFWAK